MKNDLSYNCIPLIVDNVLVSTSLVTAKFYPDAINDYFDDTVVDINQSKYKIEQVENQLLFLPLGGSGEIGMNLNLYHFNGKWIIVDMGIGFASGQIPGVDIIVPETEFLQKIKDDLLAIVITHAHEDHLGAIPYLWEYFPLDIYTTNFNAEFLKAKLNYCDFKYQTDK